MKSETVIDPITQREYTVSWDGSKGCASLLGDDDRYRRLRSDAKDWMTRSATFTLDFRPSGPYFKGSIRGE